MPQTPFFNWLTEYHCIRNLGCLEEGKPPLRLREGIDENETYKGILLVANGESLIQELRYDGLFDEDVIDGFFPVDGKKGLFSYLGKQAGNDGAFLYDEDNDQISRIYEFNNHPPGLARTRVVLAKLLPADFVSYDGRLPVRRHLGTKTRLAVKLPQAYPHVETFQIKRTPYANTCTGKVTRFTNEGLAEEFFVMRDADDRLIGVYRAYANDGDGVYRIAEQRRPLSHRQRAHALV